MNPNDPVLDRYLKEGYLSRNPTWQSEDSPWKAAIIIDLLKRHRILPVTAADVGCGAGGVLENLRPAFPDADLFGFDISPNAEKFWGRPQLRGMNFRCGNFLEDDTRSYDLILLLDVIEHLANPFEFLTRLRKRAAHFVLHIPLDLSALTVLRETPLIRQRNNVGHIHYFTRNLVLALLDETGYEVVASKYTGAAYFSPQRTWRTRVAELPRRLARLIDDDWGVRLLGGETLLILARPRK